MSANLSKSLILSLFLYFFTCSVTVDIPSPHGSRQCRECRNNTGTKLPRSTREYIYRSLYYILPVKPITGLRNDTKTCFDQLIQSILSLTPGQINCNG